MKNPNYKYYQPNRKDLKDKYGDCTIRALTKVFEISWLEAFRLTIPYCESYQCSNIFDMPRVLVTEVMEDLGFKYTGVSNAKGTKRPTVASFAKTHKQGRFIVNVAGHVVAVVDGIYYDTLDSGSCSLYGYYELIK